MVYIKKNNLIFLSSQSSLAIPLLDRAESSRTRLLRRLRSVSLCGGRLKKRLWDSVVMATLD